LPVFIVLIVSEILAFVKTKAALVFLPYQGRATARQFKGCKKYRASPSRKGPKAKAEPTEL
jgi:hypothetical protein